MPPPSPYSAVLLALICLIRLRRMRRHYAILQGEDGTESFVAAVSRQIDEVERLRGQVDRSRRQVEELRVDLGDAIRHVAVVRYDAFNDMGGRQSFSAALLDDSGDGLVVSSINGRTETRTYAKGVKGGRATPRCRPRRSRSSDTRSAADQPTRLGSDDRSPADSLRLPRPRGDVHRGRVAGVAGSEHSAELVPVQLGHRRTGCGAYRRADGAMVPFENSLEGSVSATLDTLATGTALMITAEVRLPVAFSLLVQPGVALADVTTVTTHPHAHAQCRRWLTRAPAAGRLHDRGLDGSRCSHRR